MTGFVNAQYRFVMNPNGDYTVHFADPDIFFQWHDILQVIIPRSSALASVTAPGELSVDVEGHTTCPICLSPPTAPRMTKCGHVFCFPCILHYLSTSDNKWARCPICFDSVNEKQLKCVKWYDGIGHFDTGSDTSRGEASSSSSVTDNTFETIPQEGSLLHMRLVQRPQITTLALPRSHTWPSDMVPPHQAPFHFIRDVFSFAKFMLATPAYLIANLTRDLDELSAERRSLSAMEDGLGLIFVDGADRKVREQIAKAATLETPILRETIEKAYRDQQEMDVRFNAEIRYKAERDTKVVTPSSDIPHDFVASRAIPGGSSAIPTAADPYSRPTPQSRSQPRQRRNLNPPPPSTSTYYYYQAASGLPIFLHPLDIRILLSHFHNYASFPDNITIRVESFAEGSINDDLRKRCKYLGHMPEGADVVFAETDLEGVVGVEGLKNFEGPLKQRTARRKEKGRKEDRARFRAEERERERVNTPWSSMASDQMGPVLLSGLPAEDFSALDNIPTVDVHIQEVSRPQSSTLPGAWGNRSFASALHSSSPGRPEAQRPGRPQLNADDEWDMDVAWHELEQRTGGGGGRKKRANKLVVLGSGGGGARRR
ncbi:hypothetical protein HYPSUDRAFT_1088005 [Hypholoma sublateritium FD-334 SS-4]|uniref:RING-type domain-containing protein n=1 Tax=Hypholoma sublateritium (strain FD-334 SS-4) TaxID=945553 RepID=A0A0D2PCT4_HYPSF|nr:hypothetical protein HYPSUDRAFT_1088005 [Hypholoma sublateritium FD-334 SS-4]